MSLTVRIDLLTAGVRFHTSTTLPLIRTASNLLLILQRLRGTRVRCLRRKLMGSKDRLRLFMGPSTDMGDHLPIMGRTHPPGTHRHHITTGTGTIMDM